MLTLNQSWRNLGEIEDETCSSFHHLIAALFLKPDTLMGIMNRTLYCDASGKEYEPIIVVGGFLAPVHKWNLFETEWNEVLRDFKVGRFHMREFAHSTGLFQSWKGKETKRQKFLDRLISVIVSRVDFWVGAGVLSGVYKRVDADYELHESFHPYPLCGYACVQDVGEWRRAHHCEDDPVEYVFECGDEHWTQLAKRVQEDYDKQPLFRKKDEAPLQAADFATWEILKAHRLLEIETDKLFERFRTSFQRLGEIPAKKWGMFEESSLREACRILGIPKRG